MHATVASWYKTVLTDSPSMRKKKELLTKCDPLGHLFGLDNPKAKYYIEPFFELYRFFGAKLIYALAFESIYLTQYTELLEDIRQIVYSNEWAEAFKADSQATDKEKAELLADTLEYYFPVCAKTRVWYCRGRFGLKDVRNAQHKQ